MGKTKKYRARPQDEAPSNRETPPRQDFGSNVAQKQQVPVQPQPEKRSPLQLAEQQMSWSEKFQQRRAFYESGWNQKKEAKAKVPPPLPTRRHGPAPVKNTKGQWPPAYPAGPHPDKPQGEQVEQKPVEPIEEQEPVEQVEEEEPEQQLEEQKPVEQVAKPEEEKGKKKKGFFDWLASPFKKVGKAMKGLFSGFSSKSESESEDLQPPKKEKKAEPQFDWKDFKALEKLGKGGSGAMVYSMAYLSKEWGEKIKVAGKVFNTSTDPNLQESMAKQSDREIAMMQQLPESENLLQYGGVSRRTKDEPMLLMELAEKGDMKGAFKALEASQLPEDEKMLVVRYLMRGSFRGLRDLHEADIVHGDIKDENVFLDSELTPKLGDFGTSKTTEMLEKEDEEDDIEKRTGTGPYMAPEVVTGPISKQADIWSMGETLLKGSEKDKDSVDIFKGRKVNDRNKEFVRSHQMQDDSWMKNLAETSTKKGTKEFGSYLSFVEGTMARDPEKRMTAEKALEHEFLKLDDKEEAQAKKTLGKLMTKA